MPPPSRAPLVGRDPELRVLDEVLDDLWDGGSPALVVTGEPGIGKTRMLEELTSRTAARGGVAVTGRAAEYETDLPLGVWIDALETVLVDASPVLRAQDRAALAGVLPS